MLALEQFCICQAHLEPTKKREGAIDRRTVCEAIDD
jgi:hypothetical protein